MAGIDKIYATKAQHQEFLAWMKEWLPEHAGLIFPIDERWKDQDPNMELAICNLPEKVDRKLMDLDPPEFVKQRLKEQYGE